MLFVALLGGLLAMLLGLSPYLGYFGLFVYSAVV